MNIALKKLREVGQLLIAVKRDIVDNGLILDCNTSTYIFAENVILLLHLRNLAIL